MNSFKLEISAIGQGRGQQQPRLSFVRRGISFLLFLALFATSSLPVSAQSIYRAIAVDAASGNAEIIVQPGDTFTVRFGLSYEGVEAGTTADADNRVGGYAIDARVFEEDAVIGTEPPLVITTFSTLDVTDLALGADGDASVLQVDDSANDSANNAVISIFNAGLFSAGARIDCNTNGCELGDIFQVTYEVAEDAVPSAFKIVNIATAGADTQGGVPTIRRDEFRVFVVQSQRLVNADLSGNAAVNFNDAVILTQSLFTGSYAGRIAGFESEVNAGNLGATPAEREAELNLRFQALIESEEADLSGNSVVNFNDATILVQSLFTQSYAGRISGFEDEVNAGNLGTTPAEREAELNRRFQALLDSATR